MTYRVIRSERKTVSLEISRDGEVLVRAPRRMPTSQIERFVQDKQAWLEKHLQKQTARPLLPLLTQAEVQTLAELARQELPTLVAYYAEQLGVSYGRVTVRAQHTRWGSCSSKGNLNFNCLLMLTPPSVREYIVVHELCHLKEMNHSARFWEQVARIMPSYKTPEAWLKENGPSLIRRLG